MNERREKIHLQKKFFAFVIFVRVSGIYYIIYYIVIGFNSSRCVTTMFPFLLLLTLIRSFIH